MVKTALLKKKNYNKKVIKEILASLMSSRPWRQVISINCWRQYVLSVKKVT